MFTTTSTLKLAIAITLSVVAVVATPIAAADPEPQIALLTLAGTGLPPGPLNSFSNENPKTPGIFRHLQLWNLVGQQLIPANAVIQEVRLVRISSGTFAPGTLQATMRAALSNGPTGVDVVQVSTGTLGAPLNSDPLEVYGVNAYVQGGGNVFPVNPFTGQPWVRADFDTLYAGFWARWANLSPSSVVPQYLSLNDFTIEVVYQSLQLTITSASPLNLSTGDNGRFLTTRGTPPTATYTPTFNVGAYSNPNSSCQATLSFAASSGAGNVNTGVTATPAGCSRIADNVTAVADSTTSTNSTRIVVPPQIMIKTIVGEAGAQPGDIDQQAILSSARLRFGNHDFGRGRLKTWQAVLTPDQYYGASDPTENGPDQELRNAAVIFTGEVGDIVGGSPCYWSPTFAQQQVVEAALLSGQVAFPAGTGGPTCYRPATRQIVVKRSIGANTRGGEFAGATAFMFVRERRRRDPAVVEIQ